MAASTIRNDGERDKSNSKAWERVESRAEFKYLRDQQIGDQSGEHGAVVYKGYFNGTIHIALKRYPKINVNEEIIKSIERDLEVHSSPDNRHPNFIRYFGSAEDDQFRWDNPSCLSVDKLAIVWVGIIIIIYRS